MTHYLLSQVFRIDSFPHSLFQGEEVFIKIFRSRPADVSCVFFSLIEIHLKYDSLTNLSMTVQSKPLN